MATKNTSPKMSYSVHVDYGVHASVIVYLRCAGRLFAWLLARMKRDDFSLYQHGTLFVKSSCPSSR